MSTPSDELNDQRYREKVLAARAMSEEDKMLAGPRLFDQECERIKTQLRRQHSEWSEDAVTAALCERIERQRQVEDAGLYRDAT